jgi:hypothetical protein
VGPKAESGVAAPPKMAWRFVFVIKLYGAVFIAPVADPLVRIRIEKETIS